MPDKFDHQNFWSSLERDRKEESRHKENLKIARWIMIATITYAVAAFLTLIFLVVEHFISPDFLNDILPHIADMVRDIVGETMGEVRAVCQETDNATQVICNCACPPAGAE